MVEAEVVEATHVMAAGTCGTPQSMLHIKVVETVAEIGAEIGHLATLLIAVMLETALHHPNMLPIVADYAGNAHLTLFLTWQQAIYSTFFIVIVCDRSLSICSPECFD